MTNDYQISDGVLTIAPGITYIRSQQFAQRDDIVEAVIPRGVGFMEDECFAECPSLERVMLPCFFSLSKKASQSFASADAKAV